jgi:hypothetical protein
MTECHNLQRADKYYVFSYQATGINFLQNKILLGTAGTILASVSTQTSCSASLPFAAHTPRMQLCRGSGRWVRVVGEQNPLAWICKKLDVSLYLRERQAHREEAAQR